MKITDHFHDNAEAVSVSKFSKKSLFSLGLNNKKNLIILYKKNHMEIFQKLKDEDIIEIIQLDEFLNIHRIKVNLDISIHLIKHSSFNKLKDPHGKIRTTQMELSNEMYYVYHIDNNVCDRKDIRIKFGREKLEEIDDKIKAYNRNELVSYN